MMKERRTQDRRERTRILPTPEELLRAFDRGPRLTLLATVLWQAGMKYRQIGDLLYAMGATSESENTRTKQAQRLVEVGEAQLSGKPVPKVKALHYDGHYVVSQLLTATPFVALLGEALPVAGGMLSRAAGDLLRLRVRMSLVDQDSHVVNAYITLPRKSWPAIIRRLEPAWLEVLERYAAERITRTTAELELGALGLEESQPWLRPVWRHFIAASTVRKALSGHLPLADARDVVQAHIAGIDADLAGLADARPGPKSPSDIRVLEVAGALAHVMQVHLRLDLVDLAVAASSPDPRLPAPAGEGCSPGRPRLAPLSPLTDARHWLEEATRLGAGHPGLEQDIRLRRLVLEVRAAAGLPLDQVEARVRPHLEAFVAGCRTPELAASNLRQFLSFDPPAARHLVLLAVGVSTDRTGIARPDLRA